MVDIMEFLAYGIQDCFCDDDFLDLEYSDSDVLSLYRAIEAI